MEIKTTCEYFNMKTDELVETRADSGYTREEYKLYDEALKVTFFDDVAEYAQEKHEFETWINEVYPKLRFKDVLETVNGRIAVLYN